MADRASELQLVVPLVGKLLEEEEVNKKEKGVNKEEEEKEGSKDSK